MRVQASLEGARGVLRALVVMEDEAAVVWRILPADRLLHRVDRATFSAMRSDIDRPTALREKASIAAARQSRPSLAGM